MVAIDYGLRHIGVAAGQMVTRQASPVAEVSSSAGKTNWADLEKLLTEWQPDLVLVGLPLNMDGSESDMSQNARAFARKLTNRTGYATEMVDERLSSAEARARDGSHAVAAQVIFETWVSACDS